MSAGELTRIGLSDDGRTNRWRVKPGGGHKAFEPRTTMWNHQYVECPRCGKEYLLLFGLVTIQETEK